MTDESTAAVTHLAGVGLPQEWAYIIDEDEFPDLGTMTVRFELDEHGMACFKAVEFGTHWRVAPGDMRSVPWQRIADICIREELLRQYYLHGYGHWNPNGNEYFGTDNEWQAAERLADKTTRRMRRRRNKVTDELLDEVAAMHRTGTDLETIAERFKVSRRQVDRYIARAREEGKLA